jgi:hypothetical protein
VKVALVEQILEVAVAVEHTGLEKVEMVVRELL